VYEGMGQGTAARGNGDRRQRDRDVSLAAIALEELVISMALARMLLGPGMMHFSCNS